MHCSDITEKDIEHYSTNVGPNHEGMNNRPVTTFTYMYATYIEVINDPCAVRKLITTYISIIFPFTLSLPCQNITSVVTIDSG